MDPEKSASSPIAMPAIPKKFQHIKPMPIVGVIILMIAMLALGYYLGNRQAVTQSEKAVVTPTPIISPQPTVGTPISLTPTATPSAITKVPAGWETYANTQYGFEISFPKPYQALTDANSLYGWPNGVVLIYNGGQSYDVVVEHWNTKAEYESKYASQMQNLTVHKIGNQYITLLDSTNEPLNDQIIATFTATK